jgi:hypothetical protein
VSSSEPEQHKAALEHALKPLGARNLSTFLFRSAVFFNRSSAHFWVHSNSVAAKKRENIWVQIRTPYESGRRVS